MEKRIQNSASVALRAMEAWEGNKELRKRDSQKVVS